MKFRVTYPSGLVDEIETSDANSLEQFIPIKFGSVDPAAHGVKVEVVGAEPVEPIIDATADLVGMVQGDGGEEE